MDVKAERLRGLDETWSARVPIHSFGEPSQIGGSSDAGGPGNFSVECDSQHVKPDLVSFNTFDHTSAFAGTHRGMGINLVGSCRNATGGHDFLEIPGTF